MARISSTIMTRATGSIGNITLSYQRGRIIAKQKIDVMSNPRTQGQVLQRNALSIAVAMWAYCGAVIKSGITSYPELGSQYNGFVKENIAFLKGSNIDPKGLRNSDFVGVLATNGNLGAFNVDIQDTDSDFASFSYSVGLLSRLAKVGDLVKVVIGESLHSEMGYFEKVLTANDLDPAGVVLSIYGNFLAYANNPVFALWIESADSTKSTTSKFK